MGLLKADLQQLGRPENFQGNDAEPERNLCWFVSGFDVIYPSRNRKFNSAKPLLFAIFAHFWCFLLQSGQNSGEIFVNESNTSFFLNKKCIFLILKSGKARVSSNFLYSQTPYSTHQKRPLCHLKSEAFFEMFRQKEKNSTVSSVVKKVLVKPSE